MLDNFCGPITALKRLKGDDLTDLILLYHGLKKLDPTSRRSFESTMRDKELPTYEDLVSFIQKQLRVLPSEEKLTNNPSNLVKQKGESGRSKVLVVQSNQTNSHRTSNSACLSCSKAGHGLLDCQNFLKMSPRDRYNLVKGKFCCFKCLDANHLSKNCKSQITCAQCKESHHTLLHLGSKPHPTTVVSGSENEKNNVVPISCCSTTPNVNNSTVLLSTIIAHVKDSRGKLWPIRFLIDTGSQCHFLTVKACKRLRLPFTALKTVVRGFSGTTSAVCGRTFISIQSRLDASINFPIEALIVDNVVDQLPACEIDTSQLRHLEGLTLADEKYYFPNRVDGIIGAELIPHLFRESSGRREAHELMTINSVFGHILMGRAPILSSSNDVSNCFTAVCHPSLDSLVERFWEIESCPESSRPLKPDEVDCENNFKTSVSRVESGRYIVSLSFVEPPGSLGNSYAVAERRFLNLEKRLERDGNIRMSYHEILLDYLRQGHMSLVADQGDRTGYYIPHHAIVKTRSTSTPIRIVFDAGAKTSSGLSLNDVLHSGPKLQTDIFVLLLNFPLFPVALTADIRQMYRQILVEESCRKYQRILWKFSPDNPVEIYQLNCVVFGITSSPYLALRTVHQLVEEEGENFPAPKSRIPQDMFMDDLVTSVSSLSEAAELFEQSKQLFKNGGFELTKWASNSPEMLAEFSEEEKSFSSKDFEAENLLAILGLCWQPNMDLFRFFVNCDRVIATKRTILSVVARIFDPLGLLSPFILYLKCLIKELWRLGLNWDESPPDSLIERWEKCQSELHLLSDFAIPRHIGVFINSQITLIGFCDASESGYGGVVYLKSQTGINAPVDSLLCAKSRVAPSKVVSIPRLELCAALLLAELLHSVVSVVSDRCHVNHVLAFSDSTVALCWIAAPSSKWQTFVSNRVSKIQDCCVHRWMHVSGVENPADCLSRGLLPNELVSHQLWPSGPHWLTMEESSWPVQIELKEVENPPEAKSSAVLTVIQPKTCHDNVIYSLIKRCSNYGRLLKITVLILKTLRILPQTGESDFNIAELYLCRVVQKIHFSSEFMQLNKGEDCSTRIRRLSPFLDRGVIRVGGRLLHAGLEFENCHPIVLPKSDPFVLLLIDYYHKQNCHAGPSLLLSLVRQRFWILSARTIIRICVFKCNRCFRTRPSNSLAPKMGDLPACRVTQCKPFEQCGVDYGGPIRMTMVRRRNPLILKAYICLFVCMSTKAVHIELVSDLTTPMFLAAFRRFLSRRGPCRVIHSDNGTNFVGAHAQLVELSKLLNSSEFRIDWKFIPPGAPHFGGLWEANIKSVKSHLSRVIGDQFLTYEELNTVLVQIEGVLNSRPLCTLSEDPREPLALTPSHFLTLTPLKHFPMQDVQDVPINRLTRYELVTQMVQLFWNRWRKEYLHELQCRKKWSKTSPPIKVGTVVIVDQPNTPPLQWPLGVIEQVFPGHDGEVRVVNVRLKTGVYKRPVTKLFPLPTQ